PDGATLVSGGAEGAARVWRAASGDLQGTLRLDPPAPVRELSYSADGSALAVVDADGALRVWDPATGRLKASAAVAGPGDELPVAGVGDLLALVGERRVELRDRTSGALKATFEPQHPVRRIAGASDGSLLALGGSERREAGFSADDRTQVDLWDLRAVTGGGAARLAGTLPAEPGELSALM